MPFRHHSYTKSISQALRRMGTSRSEVRAMSAIPATVTHDLLAQQQRLFRQIMGRFATGVTVVTTRIGTDTFGMTANAFMAGSLEPMLCVVSINRTSRMHGRLLQAGHYGVSFLGQEQQHLSAHFAGKPLQGVAPDFEVHGRTPVIRRALAAVTAELADTAECGDHTLFIGRIQELVMGTAARPLLFFAGRYGRLDTPPLDEAEPPAFW
jgi:flavin reductase (DIM6/NTAB) family NADH-FMN oxidoreductase RutF